MILALGVRGPEFDSRNAPLLSISFSNDYFYTKNTLCRKLSLDKCPKGNFSKNRRAFGLVV